MSPPEPMTPPECDLRGYEYMPLFGQRLFGSAFYSLALQSPRAGLAGQKLWWEAWQQCPAGSLPADDLTLCRMADFGSDVKAWAKAKEIALHGFVLCSDGRLYHHLLCKAAIRVWAVVLRYRARMDRRLELESGEWAEIRSAVFARDDYTCGYCGSKGVRLECDHVIPVSRGGQTDPGNLITACRPCNRRKAAKTPGEWLQ